MTIKTVEALAERFVVVEQKKPDYRCRIQDGVPVLEPLKYEVIDRGAGFVLYDETTAKCAVLGQYTTMEEARALRQVLVGLGT